MSIRINEKVELIGALTPEEENTLEQYKQAVGDAGAYKLNQHLRKIKEMLLQLDKTTIELLDSAIGKGKANKDLVVYRATCREDFNHFVKDNIFIDPAYASTSNSLKVLSTFFIHMDSKYPIKLIIKIPKGAILISPENEHDESMSECEYLLPRNSRYRIDDDPNIISDKRKMIDELQLSCSPNYIEFIELAIYNLTLLTDNQ